MTERLQVAQAIEAELAPLNTELRDAVKALLDTGYQPGEIVAQLNETVAAVLTGQAKVEGPRPTPILPGDVVQIVGVAHPWHTELVVVEQTHGWGVELTGPRGEGRAKATDVHVIGPAALLPPAVLAARRAALEEQS